MNNNYDLINGGALLIAQPPVNLAAGVTNGAYANMAHVHRLGILVVAAAGTASEPMVVSLTQAQAAAGTGAKALNIASLKVLDAADLKVTQAWVAITAIDRQNTVASYTATQASDTNQLALFIEVDQSDLDLANAFTHVRCNIADTGNGARQAAIVYIAQEKNYQGEPTPGLLS